MQKYEIAATKHVVVCNLHEKSAHCNLFSFCFRAENKLFFR